MKNGKFVGLLAGCFIAAFGTSLSAATLNAGSSIPAAGEAGPTGATFLFSTGVVPITAGTFTGTLTSSVYTNDSANPYGADKVTFVYVLHNNSSSVNPIEVLNINGYTGWATDASYATPASGQNPSTIARVIADIVGFHFDIGGAGVLVAGATSSSLVVQTDAKNWKNTTAAVIDGTTADSIPALAPEIGSGNGVPEPASLAIAGVAIGGLLLRRRRQA